MTSDAITHEATFTNTSNVEATQYVWTFGDNTTSSAKNPVHVYAASGTYSVKLTTKSADGKCSGEVIKSVVIASGGSYTKKVLIEEFTGAWCGYCVDGAYKVETIVNANAGKAIGVSIHQGDGMEIPLYNSLDAAFSNSGFPTGLVDRISTNSVVCYSRSDWQIRTIGELSKEAKCGLSLKTTVSTAGDSVTAEIKTGFKYALTGNYKICTYVVEDDITGTGSNYDQTNYYSSANPSGPAGTSTHPYYSLPYHITGYKHKQVVRKSIPSDLGEVVDPASLVVGGLFTKTYKFAVGTMNKANLSIVSFVYKVGTSPTTYEIMNVQKVKVGSSQSFD